MSYLLFVAVFGGGAVFFLWFRDARIFWRTGLPGYRTASYHGILFGAIALFGVLFALLGPPQFDPEVIGIGIIVLSLYLQGRGSRERIWTGERSMARLFGRAPVRKTAGRDR
jgi:hypothetical protein